MTLAEFKAWLDRYSASFTDGAPNAEQWAVISEKLAGVVPVSVSPSHPVLAPYRPSWPGDSGTGRFYPRWPNDYITSATTAATN